MDLVLWFGALYFVLGDWYFELGAWYFVLCALCLGTLETKSNRL
jgi:hypothetical protein